MKKILYFTLVLAAFSACDVLDIEPTNDIPAEGAFKDKAGIERGVLGAYVPFQNLGYYGRTYLLFADLASDNMIHPSEATSSEYLEVDNNDILPENESIDGIWRSAYEGINLANNVITKVPTIAGMSDAEKAQALGELHFIRALNLFNLLNFFGPLPLKLTPTVGTGNVDVPRSSVDAVYDQIISDLTFAEGNLAKSSVKVRASKLAATALLARVYLYQRDYARAANKAQSVIDSLDYTLLPYHEIFMDRSAESIFEIDFTATSRQRIAEYTLPTSMAGRREAAPSADMINAYEPGDERKDVSIHSAGGAAYAAKYEDLVTGEENVIVLRLAEMYLIRAEALARTEGDIATIQEDINAVRNRAGLDDTDADTYPALLTAIEQERRVEFAFEGHRWFDLVRTGRALDVVPTVTHIDQMLFPIPAEEILNNLHPDMKQNHGY